jgi:hypothetical protein
MKINPAKYECPEHHIDLTREVQKELEVDGPPVAYERKPLQRRATVLRPFEVIVTCLGGGTPHALTCIGTWTT